MLKSMSTLWTVRPFWSELLKSRYMSIIGQSIKSTGIFQSSSILLPSLLSGDGVKNTDVGAPHQLKLWAEGALRYWMKWMRMLFPGTF